MVLEGRDEAARRVAPPDQRLGGFRPARPGFDHRLVEELEV
jgi:hypothetical protein